MGSGQLTGILVYSTLFCLMTLTHIQIIGINHHTAPIRIREKMIFSAEEYQHALQQCNALAEVSECMIISTCNRMEVVVVSNHTPNLIQWLANYHNVDNKQVANHCYNYQGQEAIHHLIRVACGLDSMLLGEPEILGQLKRAFQLSQQHNTAKQTLTRLMPRLFSIAKKVRSETQVGSGSISLTYATVGLAKQHFSDLGSIRAVFIGAGHIIQHALAHFNKHGLNSPLIANRSLEHADKLAQQFQGKAIRIGDISNHLADCQLLISATASPLPILGKGLIERIRQQSQHTPTVLIDLALPRDIEPEVRTIKGVQLYDLDDLQAIVKHGWDNRRTAADRAESIINIQAQTLQNDMAIAAHSQTIRSFRSHIEMLRDREIKVAIHRIQQGNNPEKTIHKCMTQLTNRILHQPTQQLRKAASERNHELLDLAKAWFPDSQTTRSQESDT